MIDSYKHYSRFQTIAVWIVWILWTSVTSFWLANNKHSDLVEEFLWGQVGLAFVAISCMTFSSYFESRSRRLYHLICVAMALDTDVLSTKKRWYQLTKFFYPKPMYCFAFFDTSELSYLFCMKVSVNSHSHRCHLIFSDLTDRTRIYCSPDPDRRW